MTQLMCRAGKICAQTFSLQSLAALFEGSSLSEDWANPGSLVLVMAHVEGFGGFVKVVLT